MLRSTFQAKNGFLVLEFPIIYLSVESLNLIYENLLGCRQSIIIRVRFDQKLLVHFIVQDQAKIKNKIGLRVFETEDILFLKTMSERVGSGIERL